MLIKEFIEPRLGQVCYIISDNKEAAIIDPIRNIEKYVDFLESNGLSLKYIINTHPHADFITGSLELKHIYNLAKIVAYKQTPLKYNFVGVEEGDTLSIGKLDLKILHTPGHTPYCISILVNDEMDKYVFSGDFLFVGDMGRSDLVGNLDAMAEISFLSSKKLACLKDEIIILPSHINGSFCGGSLGGVFFSTIGIEKQTNRVFRFFNNKGEYIKALKSKKIEIPLFFNKMAEINLKGATLLENLPKPKEISFNELEKVEYDFIIDFRHPKNFKANYIKGSISVYEKSNYLMILGSLVDIDSKIILAGSKNYEEIIKNLRVIGFDNIIGVIKEDIDKLNLESFENNAKEVINLEEIFLSEVRKLNKVYRAICKNGYKSMAVESYLKKVCNGY